MKKFIKEKIHNFHLLPVQMQMLIDMQQNSLRLQTLDAIAAKNSESLILHGYSVFSQCDEDGILSKIFELMEINSGRFVEIGCGNGLENNSHYLLLQGWSGVWIDGSPKNIGFIKSQLSDSYNDKIKVVEAMITPENVVEIITQHIDQELDLLSLDIDSFEYETLEKAISLKPKVVCVEYNPEFRPPLKIKVKKTEKFAWDHSFYHGCSLQGLYELMNDKGYGLVSCNLSGYNAFFVKKGLLDQKYYIEPQDAYQPPRRHLIRIKTGHNKNFRFLNDVIESAS